MTPQEVNLLLIDAEIYTTEMIIRSLEEHLYEQHAALRRHQARRARILAEVHS